MSELKLREFGARAEELVDLPDLAELEHRGRDLHRRRIATVAALAAAVLVTVGVVSLQGEQPESTGPVHRPDTGIGGVQPYPGPEMRDLAAGTYSIRVSSDPYFPNATVTVPQGWNSWEGPNRFSGLDRVRNNEKALRDTSWYVGVLVLDVRAVSSGLCQPPLAYDDVGGGAASLVRAVRGIPGFRVTSEAVPDSMFGRPATHLRLMATPALADCDVNLFESTANGTVGGFADNEEVWVVDVGGDAVLIDAQWSDQTPTSVRRELEGIVDSIEFHPSELSTDG